MNFEDTIAKFANAHNYNTPINHLFNRIIVEHDIKQANINALRVKNKISEKEYYLLSNSPKQFREESIGWKIRQNPELQNIITDTINDAKYKFLISNNIDPNNIIRIANDAITHVIPYKKSYNTIIKYPNWNIEFVEKGYYNSYMRLRKTMVFLGSNDNQWNIDVKGINDNKLYLHEQFLTFLCQIVQSFEIGGQQLALQQFNDFYNKYIKKELDINFYREFNPQSCFRINGKTTYLLNDHNVVPVDKVNIDYNLSILRELYSYLMIG